MLAITRSGKTVTLNINTKLPHDSGAQYSYFPFSFECASAWSAELLKQYIYDSIDSAIRKAREEEYDNGWKDAKAKRTKKEYFRGCL